MGLKCVYLIGTNLTISFLLYKNSNSGCRRGKKQNEKIEGDYNSLIEIHMHHSL